MLHSHSSTRNGRSASRTSSSAGSAGWRSAQRPRSSASRPTGRGRPGLGRPLVDRLEGSEIHNLKELRPGSAGRSEIRILFVFDPWRSAILLVGGDKSGDWSGWYRRAIPRAEELYVDYLKEREGEEGLSR
ncbi:type II toxin-antitoxin system RelE/ParE family toxin [Actinomadura geliboluensis]|uniref:type II toxin-antitoxin system RelE/ParE family toxin n=1 Tax=Actinomadura geliboluensis TaxID=882440 RepID=UPI0037214228